MKTHNDLKELLEDFLTKTWQNLHFKGLCKDDYRFIESYLSSNSLALGKPEPLAKNKQMQEVCIDGKPHNHHILYCSECNQWVSSKGLQTE